MQTEIHNDIQNLIPAHTYDKHTDVKLIIRSNYTALRKSAALIIKDSISEYLESAEYKNSLLPPGTWFKNHVTNLANGGRIGKIETEFWMESLHDFKKNKLIFLGNSSYKIREEPVN